MTTSPEEDLKRRLELYRLARKVANKMREEESKKINFQNNGPG